MRPNVGLKMCEQPIPRWRTEVCKMDRERKSIRSVGIRSISCIPILIVFINSQIKIASSSSGQSQNTESFPEPIEKQINAHKTSAISNLSLEAGFRSAKLRWTYERGEIDPPTSFSIRFCELTSWNVEIKCQNRDLQVITKANISVINAPVKFARQLEQPGRYEALIFDLRALTNYTFQVRAQQTSSGKPPVRRLDQANSDSNWSAELTKRIQTKPFGAEATKCLPNVSEVMVNTGSFFGGLISVEGNANPSCSLIGNKSSEQSVYQFQINHELCNSKITNGSRIETMILVHENKDILTHNSARFLVLCNFLQDSFTLRASISLPKVNSVGSTHNRPAVIIPLATKPQQDRPDDRLSNTVMLGSMPGVYHARIKPTKLMAAISSDAMTNSKLNHESERNSIEDPRISIQDQMISNADLRQVISRRDYSDSPDKRARALTLDASKPPARHQPLSIRSQSRAVEFEREDASQSNRRILQLEPEQRSEREREASRNDAAELSPSTDDPRNRNPKRSAATEQGESTDGNALVMTNNHSARTDSIKIYSPASTDNGERLADNSLVQAREMAKLQRAQLRGVRGGRMQSSSDSPNSNSRASEMNSSSSLKYKLSDLKTSEDLLIANKNNNPITTPIGNSSLAHDIRNYLLRLSLNTFTDLARRSLETLLKPTDENIIAVQAEAANLPNRSRAREFEHIVLEQNIANDKAHSEVVKSTRATANIVEHPIGKVNCTIAPKMPQEVWHKAGLSGDPMTFNKRSAKNSNPGDQSDSWTDRGNDTQPSLRENDVQSGAKVQMMRRNEEQDSARDKTAYVSQANQIASSMTEGADSQPGIISIVPITLSFLVVLVPAVILVYWLQKASPNNDIRSADLLCQDYSNRNPELSIRGKKPLNEEQCIGTGLQYEKNEIRSRANGRDYDSTSSQPPSTRSTSYTSRDLDENYRGNSELDTSEYVLMHSNESGESYA